MQGPKISLTSSVSWGRANRSGNRSPGDCKDDDEDNEKDNVEKKRKKGITFIIAWRILF